MVLQADGRPATPRPAAPRTATAPVTAPPGPATEPLVAIPPDPIAASAPRHEGWVRTRPRMLLDELLCIDIAACPVYPTTAAVALGVIAQSARRPHPVPLAVSSINLDHVHHFGNGRAALGANGMPWLHLIDGAPIARQAARFLGTEVPRLSGSDLIVPLLEDADARGLRVAVLGGSPEVSAPLQSRMAREWPRAHFVGHWTPSREALADPARSRAIAAELRAAGTDIVVVCLGKPRQEEWIDAYGAATGAGVLLAFGAVVDFLAGRVSRAPRWVSAAGFEWAWRLMLEPRRLARRYLIEGPPAYLAVRRSRQPRQA